MCVNRPEPVGANRKRDRVPGDPATLVRIPPSIADGSSSARDPEPYRGSVVANASPGPPATQDLTVAALSALAKSSRRSTASWPSALELIRRAKSSAASVPV